ncbi:SIMPL domain-containing protein [Candidatus Woesearchaeota archaeon]|nr:SIMPL domain-containing protein [Candidatus Woesearchaeota archaeon]MBW3005221.1 SIMPL domain-containing protein [Candidatus Woesearchaeota archaeon]
MKTKIIFSLIMLFLVLGCRSIYPAESEEAWFEQEIEVPQLIGKGEVLTPSDYALVYIRIGVITATKESAIKATNRSMQQIIQALAEAGIQESNIKYEGGIEPTPRNGYGAPDPGGFSSSPLISIRIDDMENLRKYLNAVVPFYASMWIEFELTEENKEKAGKEALKLAREDIKTKGASFFKLLFAKKHVNQELSRINKYPEKYYAASVEQTLEEAQQMDLTPKPVKTIAQIVIVEKMNPKEFEDYLENLNVKE